MKFVFISGTPASGKIFIAKKLIVPKVCAAITREDFINYLANVVEKDINFTFYVDRKPSKFEKLIFHGLL